MVVEEEELSLFAKHTLSIKTQHPRNIMKEN